MYAYMYTCVCVHVCMHMCKYVYVYMCVPMLVCMHMHICTHNNKIGNLLTLIVCESGIVHLLLLYSSRTFPSLPESEILYPEAVTLHVFSPRSWQPFPFLQFLWHADSGYFSAPLSLFYAPGASHLTGEAGGGSTGISDSLLSMQVLPNHGLHAASFIAAFLISLLLTLAALFFLARGRCLQGSILSRFRVSLPPGHGLVGSGMRWTLVLLPDASQSWTKSHSTGDLRTDIHLVCPGT